jgi:hypothetical protein
MIRLLARASLVPYLTWNKVDWLEAYRKAGPVINVYDLTFQPYRGGDSLLSAAYAAANI